ncbi:hypothetical protein VDF90_09390 [Xanthomonas campestris pv. raphani]|uniref:hypothetical protein n=1 Tax=Xanthomonas campestris TaxID=339 RepID=UPI000CDA3B6F|nr:hypothetical protein [Xanthomonas campestris]MCC5068986.1 hypothetical protein [Xanthomonas campestris]MCW1983759.1 hypothetical protein [Xanthomonas campestris]MCW2009177.1 hypothetical protein [Xanthomonas campestris]MEA0737259.1 hypothetical protein [Xanthomonas campestris pv. campestris]MEA9787458.1 hypothetical protein [Xanthomonas campestris pv. raphani]
MPVKDLTKASDLTLRSAYEQDYKTDREKKDHVHRQVINIINKKIRISGIDYDVIDLGVLRQQKYSNVANFLQNAIKNGGVRPDTPFHQNLELRYPVDAVNSYRYVEYNVIGGGMRIVFDSETRAMFLSAHYSSPALITDSSADECIVADIACTLAVTQQNLRRHSDGTFFGLEDQSDLWIYPKRDPVFKAWLENKGSCQAQSTLKAYNLL